MDYKATVFLPKTEFPMRGDLPAKEPAILESWQKMGLFRKLRATSKGRPKFMLHDGPPYANGNIHIGHALNKILKDVINRSQQMLGKDGDRLQGVFVTVDPERDTPEVLKAYMGNFDPSFLALYGTPEQLAAVAKDFKIYYKKVDGKTPTSYTMDHSAGSYVYDPSGRLRVYNRYGSGAQALAADVKVLLAEAGG